MGFVSVEIRHVDVFPSSWEIEVVMGDHWALPPGLHGFR